MLQSVVKSKFFDVFVGGEVSGKDSSKVKTDVFDCFCLRCFIWEGQIKQKHQNQTGRPEEFGSDVPIPKQRVHVRRL